MNHERKEPTTLFAIVSFLVIIAVLIIICDHNSIVEYSME